MPVIPKRPIYRRILVPTDGSLVSARAEKAAIEVAKRFKAAITAVHVVAPYSPTAMGEIGGMGPRPMSESEYRHAAEKRGNAVLKKVVTRARRARLRADQLLVTSDSPADALVRAAEDAGCDLIILGSNNRVGIQRIFLGSVASEILNNTRIPTLICH